MIEDTIVLLIMSTNYVSEYLLLALQGEGLISLNFLIYTNADALHFRA